MNFSIQYIMKTVLLLINFLVAIIATAQKLPLEYHYSEDGIRLIRGGNLSTGLYDLAEIKTVELTFEQENYWQLLADNYDSETPIVATIKYDDELIGEVGVRFRGNSSYFMIPDSDKKSFKLDTDFVIEDLKIRGYKNLRFNNAHLDASFMREVLYYKLVSRYVPLAKANYIRLLINGEDWGLYPNVQHIDKTFLNEWFLSNDGALFRAKYEEETKSTLWHGESALNYLGQDTSLYQNNYLLKSSDIENPWGRLMNACYVLNEINADNYEEIEQYFNIDNVLWFLAVENIFTDDDSYVNKGKDDYMIYFEAETGLLNVMEYDGNSTFQIRYAPDDSWGPFKNVDNPDYPLLNRLLTVQAYRQRYLAHYRTILEKTLNSEAIFPIIDSLDLEISELVKSDPKKLYSYQDYEEAIEILQYFILTRNNYLFKNSEVQQKSPDIEKVVFYNENMEEYLAPSDGESGIVKAWLSPDISTLKVNLYYSGQVVGKFNIMQMYDDGNHNDDLPGDGIYGAQIPGMEGGKVVRFYVEAIADTKEKSVSYYPACAENEVFTYTVEQNLATNGVVINELMASNSVTVSDEEGNYEDWVELYNNNDFDVDLKGYYLSDDTNEPDKWQFSANTIIEANGYLIIWTDDDDEDGPLHTSFKLSASGEVLSLYNPEMELVDQIAFGEQTTDLTFARYPNGTGNFRIQSPTFDGNNDAILAVEDNLVSEGFLIYPNPVEEKLHIRVQDEINYGVIIIVNSVGERIYSSTADNKVVDVSGWPTGVYVIIVGNRRQKFIKR